MVRKSVVRKRFSKVNRHYYDSLWSGARLVEPQRFNTWPLVQSMLPAGGRQLEVAPGLRPRLPLENTHFVDISEPALAKLRERGASVTLSQVTSLPFADHSFDLVCALDIVEHVEDDDGALSEITRVAKPGASLLLSASAASDSLDAFRRFRRTSAALCAGAFVDQNCAVRSGRRAQRRVRLCNPGRRACSTSACGG